MSPSETIITQASKTLTVTDAGGRHITLRRLTALGKLRLFKAAGSTLSHNQYWLGMATLACSVQAIDDVPVPMPTNELQIEALVGRLGDTGIAAIAAALGPDPLPDAAGVVSLGN